LWKKGGNSKKERETWYDGKIVPATINSSFAKRKYKGPTLQNLRESMSSNPNCSHGGSKKILKERKGRESGKMEKYSRFSYIPHSINRTLILLPLCTVK